MPICFAFCASILFCYDCRRNCSSCGTLFCLQTRNLSRTHKWHRTCISLLLSLFNQHWVRAWWSLWTSMRFLYWKENRLIWPRFWISYIILQNRLLIFDRENSSISIDFVIGGSNLQYLVKFEMCGKNEDLLIYIVTCARSCPEKYLQFCADE